MACTMKNYKRSKTTDMMRAMNNILYLCGLPHFWIEPANFSHRFTNIFDVISVILHFLSFAFTFFLLAAFVTQNNLTPKQRADRFVVNSANPVTYLYDLVFLYHREKVREILYKLMVILKEDHNDEVEEKKLIEKFKMYVSAFLGSSTMTLVFFAVFGLYQASTGLPFVTIITAWPDVDEVSTAAGLARVIFYIFWWIHFLRICGVYLLLLAMLIGLSQQYKNLQSYFYSLNYIFDEKQVTNDEDFEKAYIKGVQMHAETIWCLNQCKHVCSIVFDAQMLLATITFVSLLPELMSANRDLGNALANVPTAVLCLVATGYFMWNAGDISVEASFLPDAMYGSGWQNCKNSSSIRIRKLVFIAMAQARQPVTLKALGFIDLSYNSYLQILKTSHSVFSVFY